jgi:hypothetical protein
MKLPNYRRGPVTLKKIDYAPNLSEETLAFTAEVHVDGLVGSARNDGRGGENFVQPAVVVEALNRYAASLPTVSLETSRFPGSLSMDADLLLSEMVAEAITAREHARMRAKGFTYYASAPEISQIAFYTKSAALPSDIELRRLFKNVPLAEVKQHLRIVEI